MKDVIFTFPKHPLEMAWLLVKVVIITVSFFIFGWKVGALMILITFSFKNI